MLAFFLYLVVVGIPSNFALCAANKVIRVCQSPACRDDGAQSTLDTLAALAAPGCQIIKGGCVSLCGSGPVVEILPNAELDDTATTTSSIKRKKVKGDVLLSLLDELSEQETDISSFMRQRLVMGYEQSLEAKAAYEAKDYQSAVQLYEEAIQIGRKPAMELEEARSSSFGDIHDNRGMSWLVDSFRNSCRSRLALKDIDGARRDAFAATVFSQNRDADSHICLASVCFASGDKLGELQAVKAAIEQYQRIEDEHSKPLPGKDAVARAEAAKIKNNASTTKRELGFRLAKLERELKATS
jgi:tetratricopeptide (TPR) repeat protein